MQPYELYFNNRMCTDIGVYVAEPPSIPPLVEDVDSIPIDGRNGDVIIKNGTYKNREFAVKFRIPATADYQTKQDAFMNWITNYSDNRLRYDSDTRCFRVLNVELGSIKREIGMYSDIEVKFTLEPFRQALSDTTNVITTSGSNIACEGDIGAIPTIQITGSGNVTLTVNEKAFTVENITTTCTIDCEKKTVYSANGKSKDYESYGIFPTLTNGTNNIQWSGKVTNIKVTYRNLYR